MASSPTSTRRYPYVVLGVAVVIVVLGAFALRSITQPTTTVATAEVTYQNVVKSSPTNGKVQPIDDFKLTAQAAGQVVAIYVKVGQQVKPGQMLLKMDDRYALASLAHANSAV